MTALESLSIGTHTTVVLAVVFFLAVLLGVLLQRGLFCTMGAISDWVLMDDGSRLRQWAIALLIPMSGLGALSMLGWAHPADGIYAAASFPWLSYLLGGFAFGVGMVLASGCPGRNLVRLASGSLKALLVLVVTAVFALASMRGTLGLWRVQWLDTFRLDVTGVALVGQMLTHWTGWSAGLADLLAALVLAIPLLIWVLSPGATRSMWPGIGVGVFLLLMFVSSGVLGFVAEHPDTLESTVLGTASHRMEGLSFVSPLAQWLDAFLYVNNDRTLNMGMLLLPGILLGAWFSAWRSDTFRWQGFTQVTDLARHMAGAALMGMGGVAAMGCSFGQGLTGLSTLSWGSMLATGAMVLGTVSALRVQFWLAERQS